MTKPDFKGSSNPFYGRRHTPETIAKISANRKGRGLGNQNAKGYKHSPEELKQISDASKALWRKRFENPELRTYQPIMPERFQGFRGRIRRGEWSQKARRRWRKDKCDWCNGTERLNLDHIVPRILGGKAIKSNAQTLCEPCNHWKHNFIDTPVWKSLFQTKQGTT